MCARPPAWQVLCTPAGRALALCLHTRVVTCERGQGGVNGEARTAHGAERIDVLPEALKDMDSNERMG